MHATVSGAGTVLRGRGGRERSVGTVLHDRIAFALAVSMILDKLCGRHGKVPIANATGTSLCWQHLRDNTRTVPRQYGTRLVSHIPGRGK